MTNLLRGKFQPSGEWQGAVLLVVICLVLMAAGFTMTTSTSARSPLPPIALGDVADAQVVEIRDQRGRVVLTGEFRSSVDKLGNTEKDAPLTDKQGRTVIGEVEVEIPSAARTNRRPELEVDILGLPVRETFTVVIDDRVVASFMTDDRGSVDMELQEGETPAFPDSSGGSGLPSSQLAECTPFAETPVPPAIQR